MAEDMVPSLLKRIQTEFDRRIEADPRIQAWIIRANNGTATLFEVSQYARRLGEQLSDILLAYMTQDALPDGRIYYNIAQRIIGTTLNRNYDLTNQMAAQVQEALNRRENINIRPVKAPRPKERIKALVDSLTEDEADFSIIQSRLNEPIRNISQSFFDDYVEANAKFRQQSGLETSIERRASSHACPWCQALAGVYSMDALPDDIYRRHDNCSCAVSYRSGRFRQNVHNKRWYDADDNALNARKLVGLDVTRLTPQEAAIREQLLEQVAKKAAQQRKNSMIEQYQRNNNVSHRRAANRVGRALKAEE